MIDRAILRDLPLLDGVSDAAIQALAAHGVAVNYAPNAVIFLAGAEARGWYIVLDGSVRVVRGAGDRQHVVHTETRGGTLAEVPLFTNGAHPATGIAAEPTTCAVFERTALERAIAQSPEIAFLMARRLALRTADLVQRLHDRSTASVQLRLIEFLLRQLDASRAPSISLGMTQQALAEELGTVRAVVARELASLGRKGLIEGIGGGRYRIPDRNALEAAGRR